MNISMSEKQTETLKGFIKGNLSWDDADKRTINSLSLKGFIKVAKTAKGYKVKVTATGKKALN